MISKIIILNAIFVAANARLLFLEPAVSSQNVVRHDEASLHHKIPVAHYTVSVGHHVFPAIHHGTHHGHAIPAYDFSYSVSDKHTGDYKSHHESRIGDTVRGFYSLVQPDGSIRKVQYSADGHTGFKAIVRNTVPVLGHSYRQY